jgi:hypothetical protein
VTPPDDPGLLASLYPSPLEFEDWSQKEEYDIFRIHGSDLAVRDHKKSDHLVMSIEGELLREVS